MAVSKRRQFSAEKGICHMSNDTIATLPDPSGFSPDPLTGLIRDGARKLIEQAVEAELAALLEAFADNRLADGRARLVRHGHLPERDVLTGVGPVPVKVPRVRDRAPGTDKITFTPIRAVLLAIAIVARRAGLRSRSCMIQGCTRPGNCRCGSAPSAAPDEGVRDQKPCRFNSASMRARDAVWRVGNAAK